jgi:hypothetical protein
LRELRVTIVLAGIGSREKLLGCGEFSGKLCTIEPVCAPGLDERDTQNHSDEECREFEQEWRRHTVYHAIQSQGHDIPAAARNLRYRAPAKIF